MLVTGADIGLDFSRLGKTQRIFCLATRPSSAPGFQPVVGMSSELPFASDSLDALVLCHTLNVAPTPHEVLRECQRVLVPNGHLFVVSFNPAQFVGRRAAGESSFAPQEACPRPAAAKCGTGSPCWVFRMASRSIWRPLSP